jgi:hypothetical protein
MNSRFPVSHFIYWGKKNTTSQFTNNSLARKREGNQPLSGNYFKHLIIEIF